MSSYHKAIAQQVFLENYQALLETIHNSGNSEQQGACLSNYVHAFKAQKLESDNDSDRYLSAAEKFGINWPAVDEIEKQRIQIIQLGIVSTVFEVIAKMESSLYEDHDLSIEEIEPQKQAILNEFIKEIMPDSPASVMVEEKLLGGIAAKIAEKLPSVNDAVIEQNALRELELAKKEQAKQKEEQEPQHQQIAAVIDELEKEKPKREAVAQQNSNWNWPAIGFFAAGAAIVGLTILSKGRSGPSL